MNSQTDRCYHGGAFFKAIGEGFDHLERHQQVINADVLDAWFPPAPSVIETVTEYLPWLARTSPPTHSEGLIETISESRGVPQNCVLPGAGSSALIFLALREWLTPSSKVLMLDPSYGEYSHVCEQVIGCQVDRIVLQKTDHYRIDLDHLSRQIQAGYDLVILINPNNPSGHHIEKKDLKVVLENLPENTRCWVDEAYIEYVDASASIAKPSATTSSLETLAAASANIFVCKSLSKVYALSGVRAAYLVGNSEDISRLRTLTPPWAVSLPAQLAAVKALKSPEYYNDCYQKTDDLRQQLSTMLSHSFPGSTQIVGVANWVLWIPPVKDSEIAPWVARCQRHHLFLRTFTDPGHPLGSETIRISVKDQMTQVRMIEILQATQPQR